MGYDIDSFVNGHLPIRVNCKLAGDSAWGFTLTEPSFPTTSLDAWAAESILTTEGGAMAEAGNETRASVLAGGLWPGPRPH